MAQRYRAAVIGCGAIGSRYNETMGNSDLYSHAAAHLAHPRVELAALCDADPARLAAAADHWGVAARHTEAAGMLAQERPEIVSICTPDSEHGAHLRLALAAPATRAVLCEKPLAADRREAAALVAEAESRGIHLAVNHIRRWDAGHRRAAALVREGGIGTVLDAAGRYGKGVRHTGTHLFDLLRMILGEPLRLRAEDRLGEGGGDPSLDVEAEFAGNVRARLTAHDASAYHLFELELTGREGRVSMGEAGHRLSVRTAADSRRYPGVRELGPARPLSRGMRHLTAKAVADLVACLDGRRRAPACTGRDGLAALAMANAALASARAGGTWQEIAA